MLSHHLDALLTRFYGRAELRCSQHASLERMICEHRRFYRLIGNEKRACTSSERPACPRVGHRPSLAYPNFTVADAAIIWSIPNARSTFAWIGAANSLRVWAPKS